MIVVLYNMFGVIVIFLLEKSMFTQLKITSYKIIAVRSRLKSSVSLSVTYYYTSEPLYFIFCSQEYLCSFGHQFNRKKAKWSESSNPNHRFERTKLMTEWDFKSSDTNSRFLIKGSDLFRYEYVTAVKISFWK